MSRSQRLLDLIQLLRTFRYAVKAEKLANELGVSVRTVYRDVRTLQAQGAPIEGEAGVGYLLKPGFTLPPLMFGIDEIEALVLGISWVADRADRGLAAAARNLVAKIKAVLPTALKNELEATTLLVGPPGNAPSVLDSVAKTLRLAIREERKLEIEYVDERGKSTVRTVWVFGLGYFENVLIAMAWCQSRRDFRHFRADRIQTCRISPEKYPESHEALLERWRIKEGIASQDLRSV